MVANSSAQSGAENSCASLIRICERWAMFWPNSAGWGPSQVTDVLTHSLMQRQLSLAQSLEKWLDRFNDETNNGDLLLAWVNLAAVMEGALKLYFCVYYLDWIKDPKSPTQKGVLIEPSDTFFDKLIIFSDQKSLFSGSEIHFLRIIRDQRNLIHPFKAGVTLDLLEFKKALIHADCLCSEIDSRLPYPD